MEEYLIATIVATIIVVALISHVVGRFGSLPIDLVGAGVAVDILFFDEIHRALVTARQFAKPGDLPVGVEDVPMFALYAIVLGVTFSVVTVGIYVAWRGQRKIANVADDELGNSYLELGYALSLMFSMVLLYCAFGVNHAIPMILASEKEMTLFETAGIVLGGTSTSIVMLVALAILYFLFLSVRYYPAIDPRIRALLSARKETRRSAEK
jgi:hypothetical protein